MVNLRGQVKWHQPHPPDVEPTDVAKRDIWLAFKGYLLKVEDADEFMSGQRMSTFGQTDD